ncbi:hypothetical protein Dda_7993 [Drechslerella dactyloides]|uniref:Chromosome segregation ATPase family protein n=1 Tax=Drechslerella dactyloides TaxID=74499 RepID=A0AAD6NHT7_DREDA|nr:hypothetical protein Dda_7993 [Drechslerella dactyloides]
MPSGTPEFPELRKTASQNFSPPMYVLYPANSPVAAGVTEPGSSSNPSLTPGRLRDNACRWDSSDPGRRPKPLPTNTNPELHPIGPAVSPTKGSPTKSFTPSSVHRRLDSLQTQSSSNVRELSNAFNTQISGPKPPGGSASSSPFKYESPTSSKKDRERDRGISSVSIPPLFGNLKPKGDPGISRMPAPPYDAAPISAAPSPSHASTSHIMPSASTAPPMASLATDRFAAAINNGDFQILSGQLNNLLAISNSLQKEMVNLSRRSKDNAMDLMSLKEATNNRDEDIRKSLKDLASGLTFPSAGRLAITSGPDPLDFDGTMTRYGSPNDIHRSFVSDAEEVLRQSHAKRKSIGKDIQSTMDNHSTERLLRDMATKESQRRITELLELIQAEIASQGKTVSSKFSEVLRNIQSAGLSGTSPNAVIRYSGHGGGDENDHGVILDLLEVLKTSMEERMDDLQNSLSLINNGSSAPSSGGGSVDVSNRLKPVEEAIYNNARITGEIKDLISNLQGDGASMAQSTTLGALVSQIGDISTKLDAMPASISAASTGLDDAVSTLELKDMLKTLIEMASRNETGTHKAVEVLMHKLGELSAFSNQNAVGPSSDAPGDAGNTVAMLQPIFAELKANMSDLQGDVAAQEKVIEKALEIILRELNKVTPSVESKVSELVASPTDIAAATQSSLQQDFGAVSSKISTVEGTLRDSMNVIQTQLQVITETASAQMYTIKPDGKDGEPTVAPRPHFDGSVAAVSAIGAMGKDLKHTMENLQSDITGREQVTEKAMEIILREIGTINKAVTGVPNKVVDSMRAVQGYGDDVKQTMQELQADVLGREKHTEKALEIILRELQTVAANFDKAQLAIAHSQEQKANIASQAEKDIKFNLETVVTRSNRIADTTASIQELLEAFHTAQTDSNKSTQDLISSMESAIKTPVNNLETLIQAVQEQFKSTTANTAQSIIEVAKYLDTLGEKTTASAGETENIKKILTSVQDNFQNFDSANKEMNESLVKRLESMVAELQESNSKAIESSKAPLEDELTQEKEANSKVITELKGLIDSLKEGFAQSVVTTETRNSELSQQLETYCQSAREDQQQTQSDIRSVKESVVSLQSDDGTLAKILLAMKDVAEYLAKSSTAETETKEDPKLDEILSSILTKDDARITQIHESMLTKEDAKISEIHSSMLTKDDPKITQIFESMVTKEDPKLAEILDNMLKKEDPKLVEILNSMLTKEDPTLAEIRTSMLTKEDPKLAEIQSSMLTKEDPKLTEIQTLMSEVSEQIKSFISSNPGTSEEEGSDIKAKLETLINHSNHQAKFFSQMSLLDDVQKKVEGTSVQITEFITNQNTLLQTTAATERHEAAEATLAKEKALAEKSVAEATTTALKAEELNLQNSISSLRLDNEDLTKRKQQLSAELSSIETALALRREEMALLEARAETLEKRMVEGVIHQSRSLLLAKSTAAASKPLRRIVNPPAVGTVRSANGASGRRIVSMNIANNSSATISVPDSQTRTPSGSSIFPNTSSAIRRAQSVRTSAHTSRKTSWSVMEPVIQDDVGGENKENEAIASERSPVALPANPSDEAPLEKVDVAISKLDAESGLATLDTIEDDDTDRDESSDKSVVLASDSVTRNEKRYPSSLSASSDRRDSIGSRTTQDEEVD